MPRRRGAASAPVATTVAPTAVAPPAPYMVDAFYQASKVVSAPSVVDVPPGTGVLPGQGICASGCSWSAATPVRLSQNKNQPIVLLVLAPPLPLPGRTRTTKELLGHHGGRL